MSNIGGLSTIALTINVDSGGNLSMNASTSQKVGQYRYIATNIYVKNESSSDVKLDGTASALKLQFGLKTKSSSTLAAYLLPLQTAGDVLKFIDTNGNEVTGNNSQPALCDVNQAGSYLYYSGTGNKVTPGHTVNFQFKTGDTNSASGHVILPYSYMRNGTSSTGNLSYRKPYGLPDGWVDDLSTYQLMIFAKYGSKVCAYNAGFIDGSSTDPANSMVSIPYHFTMASIGDPIAVEQQEYFD